MAKAARTGRGLSFVSKVLVLSFPLGFLSGSGLLRGARLFLYFGVRHDRTGRGRGWGERPKRASLRWGTAKKRRRRRRRQRGDGGGEGGERRGVEVQTLYSKGPARQIKINKHPTTKSAFLPDPAPHPFTPDQPPFLANHRPAPHVSVSGAAPAVRMPPRSRLAPLTPGTENCPSDTHSSLVLRWAPSSPAARWPLPPCGRHRPSPPPPGSKARYRCPPRRPLPTRRCHPYRARHLSRRSQIDSLFDVYHSSPTHRQAPCPLGTFHFLQNFPSPKHQDKLFVSNPSERRLFFVALPVVFSSVPSCDQPMSSLASPFDM